MLRDYETSTLINTNKNMWQKYNQQKTHFLLLLGLENMRNQVVSKLINIIITSTACI